MSSPGNAVPAFSPQLVREPEEFGGGQNEIEQMLAACDRALQSELNDEIFAIFHSSTLDPGTRSPINQIRHIAKAQDQPKRRGDIAPSANVALLQNQWHQLHRRFARPAQSRLRAHQCG